jgi:hypothetical protein
MDTIKISNVIRYFEIAHKALFRVKNHCGERNKFIGTERTDEMIYHAAQVHSESIICVVFSTMTLEAFINEYGIQNSSKSYFEKHLDQLKLISKFLLLPRIFGKSEISTDSEKYLNLKWLINLRNDIVHFNVKERKPNDLNFEKVDMQKDFILENHALKAFNTMKEIIEHLDKDTFESINLNIKAKSKNSFYHFED